jgi:hypothetical protein
MTLLALPDIQPANWIVVDWNTIDWPSMTGCWY